MTQLARNRVIGEVPANLEVVRRKVMMTIHAVERETDLFLLRYLTNVGEPERWEEVIRIMCDQIGKRVDELNDFKDLHQIIRKYRLDPEHQRFPEIAQLRRMVDRGKMFDYIAFSLRNDMVSAYNSQLKKYCLSFHQEAKGKDLHSVTQYENNITDWKTNTKNRLEKVDDLLDEYDEYKSPLTQYISHYPKVFSIMEKVCRGMVQVCEPIKRWATSDSTYHRRLQEDINMHNKRKMDIRDITKHLEFDMDQTGLKLRRRAFFTLKLDRKLSDVRDELRNYKRRENEIRENLDKTEAEMSRKKRDLEEVRTKFKTRKDNSPAVYNFLSGLIETLREDIWKLEGKHDTIQGQINAVRKKEYQIQKELDKLNTEMNASNHFTDTTLREHGKKEGDLHGLRNEVKLLDSKIDALKKIREIKLTSDTVKKIHHFGYTPGRFDRKDDLESAFKITAGSVGKHWVKLYKELPFRPQRDQTVRNLDIEVIDRSLRRIPDGGMFTSLAMKSLEKWKRLSTVASLPELISTLKKLRQKDTVKKIEMEMRAVST